MNDFSIWTKICRLVVDAKSAFKDEAIQDIEIDRTIGIRADIRTKVNEVSECILKAHNPKVAKYVTFGLVVWLDEIMTEPYEHASHPWPSLQQELYETEDGGVKFYEYVDEALSNPLYPELVYQFYTCAFQEGFRGKYIHDHDHIVQSYISRLRDVLKNNEPEAVENSSHMPETHHHKGFRSKVLSFAQNHYGLCLFSSIIGFYGVYSLLLFMK